MSALLAPRIAAIVGASIALSTGRIAAEPPALPPDTALPPLDEVLVTGEQPGPGMWRISSGEHEMWILGTLDPLPKRMTWRSRQAEAMIAKSQEVLAPPGVGLSVGFFKGLAAVPSLLRARKNAGGRTLKDVLPQDVYERWRVLKDRYLGADDGVERLRPSVAAHELYQHALERSGLAAGDGIWSVVEKSAKRHHVPIAIVKVNLALDDPKATIRQFEQIPREPDVACLASTIERLETDLQPMRRRASLWSLGDVDALRRESYADQRVACFDALMSVPELRAQVLNLRAQLVERWLSAAQRALATNETTFAVLPITQLLEPDGWVARLRANGYDVEEP